MTRIEEIEAACKTLEHCEFHGKGFEAESTLLNNASWLLEMVKRMKLYVQVVSMSPHSCFKGIKKARALLAELEGK